MAHILLCGKCHLPLVYEKAVEDDSTLTLWCCHEHGVMGWFADYGKVDLEAVREAAQGGWDPEDFWIGRI